MHTQRPKEKEFNPYYKPYINYLERGSKSEGRLLAAYEQVQTSITTYMKVKFWISLGKVKKSTPRWFNEVRCQLQ